MLGVLGLLNKGKITGLEGSILEALSGLCAERLEYEIYSLSFLVSFFARTKPAKTK